MASSFSLKSLASSTSSSYKFVRQHLFWAIVVGLIILLAVLFMLPVHALGGNGVTEGFNFSNAFDDLLN